MRDPWVCAIGNVSLVAIAETTTLVPCHAEKFLHGFHLKMGHQYSSHSNDHQGDTPNMYPHKKTPEGTVYPKKYAHGFCFAVLCRGYTLTDFPISIRLTSLALWQSNDCPSASKATLMNMDKYFMWIHYERLHNHNKAKHNKTVCIFLGVYCIHLLSVDVISNGYETRCKCNIHLPCITLPFLDKILDFASPKLVDNCLCPGFHNK